MRAIVVLGLVEFIRGALVFSLLPLYGRFEAGFGLAVIGLAISIHYLMDNIFRIPAGWLTDRFGGKWLMAGGLLLSFSGVYLLSVTKNAAFFVAGTALFGLGAAPVWPTVITGVTAKMPAHQISEALSKVFMAWLVGAGLGPVVINFIIGKAYLYAFACLFGLFVVALLFAVTGEMPGIETQRELPTSTFLKELWQELIALKILYPGMFVQTLSVGILMPVIAIYVRSVFGFDAREFSYLLIGGGIFTILLLIPAGRIIDRVGIKGPLVAGLFTAAAALALLPLQKVITHALVPGVLLGISYAFILPAWNGLQARVVSPEKRGTMWAFFMTIEGIGTAVGAYIGGRIYESFGQRAPFFASAFFLAAVTVFYVFGNLNKLMREEVRG